MIFAVFFITLRNAPVQQPSIEILNKIAHTLDVNYIGTFT